MRTKDFFKKSYENKPLISIITVVFNGELYLEETIQSVIRQTYENIEYIIIDGGSTDGTLDIIKKYNEHIDYWISETDNGIYDAMNKGILKSKGEIIGIVNADDIMYDDTVDKIVFLFESQRDMMFTYGNLDLMNESSQVISTAYSLGMEHFKYRIFRYMPFLHPTMFIKKGVYEKIGLYNTYYRVSSDYDFVLRMIENDCTRGVKLTFSTGRFRLGGRSGGYETYIENHQILLQHGVNIFIVYLNSGILFLKLFFRKLFL